MDRAKLLRLSFKLVNSISSTQQSGIHWRMLNQVTHFSYLSQSPLFYLSKSPPSYYISSDFHQNLHFSSKPESFVDFVLSSNDWSEEFENELEKLNPKITHESVVYVLKKLNQYPQKSFDFFKYVCDRKGFQPSHVPYSLLLRSLACGEFMEKFWKVATEMKEKGFCIDEQIHGFVIDVLKREKLDKMAAKWTEFHQSSRVNDVGKKVVEVILGSDWSEKVESELEKLKFPLNDYFLFEVFWKLRGEPLRALKFFKWVSSSLKYEHNSLTYGGMARVLARRGLFDEFWDLVNQMRSEGHEIDHDLYLKITRGIGNREAVKLFEFMMDSPYKLSDQECVWLLMTLSRDFDPDINLVNRVVNKYLEAGNAYTKAIYHGIHRSLCKVGKFDEANKIVEEMRSAGYKPDNITYSQKLLGLCNHQRLEDARLVLNRMEAEGFVPDKITWTILIQGYLRAGQVDQALSCFARMLEKKLEPDADMLEVLIKGFLSQNKILGAYRFLAEMVNMANLKPWHATYKLMIDRLLQGGELEEAFDLLSMMKQQSYPPYADPFFVYISKSGTVEDAKKLLRALPMKGSPSIEAYVKVISSFFEQGRHSEAKNLLDSSPDQVHHQKTIRKMFGLAQSSSRI